MKRMISALWMLLVMSATAGAQLRIVSTSITNGQTNVPQTDTLWITFSEPVNVLFDAGGPPQARFMRFVYGPMNSMRISNAVFSADTMRIGIPYTLTAGVAYQTAIEMAMSTRGQRLAMPLVLRFSTGGAVTTGSISGSVRLAADAPAKGFVVVAYATWALNNRLFDEPLSGVVASTRTDSSGAYMLSNLPDGNYLIRAFQEQREPTGFGAPGFSAAFYDANNDRFPDAVAITRTQRQVTDIGLRVRAPGYAQASTAASRDSAYNVARRRGASFALVQVLGAGRLDSAGAAPGWLYHFRSNEPRNDLFLWYTGSELLAGAVTGMNGQMLTPVATGWANSEAVAAAIKPVVAAMNPVEPPFVSAMITTVPSQQGNTGIPQWVTTIEAKQADGRIPRRVVLLDAGTATAVIPPRIAAQAAVDSANNAIARLASPLLWELVSVNGLADTSGKADFWQVMYYNYATRSMLFATVDGRGNVRMDNRRDNSPFAPPRLRGRFLDSPAILDSSLVWSRFAATRGEARASLSLKTVYLPFPPDTVTVWTISSMTQQMPAPSQGPNAPGFVQDVLVASTGKPYQPARFLAFDGSENAVAVAKTWRNDAALVRLGAGSINGMQEDGKAGLWQYVFYSASRPDSILNMLVAGNATKTDFYVRRVDFRDTTPVPVLPSLSGLINSDRALAIAESSGGLDFRVNNPGELVMASLDQIRVRRDSSLALWSVAYPFAGPSQFGHFRVLINAATGEVIRERARTTDRAPFETALKAAQEWSRDAQFRYAKADSVNADGLVEVWVFGFWSNARREALFVEVTGGTTITRQWTTTDVPARFAKGAPIRNWLESAVALAKAENAIGAVLRRQGVLAQVQAELTNSSANQAKISGDETAQADADYWVFTYIKTTGGTETASVNETGSVTTSNEVSAELPKTLRLEQNFPNPFNPVTVISYTLPASGEVRLEVFNMLGQKVATLVNGVQSAGTHQLQFNAAKLSSGIYFYRLTSGTQTVVRRMTLVK